MMGGSWFEFPDSEVQSAAWHGDTLHIVFSAAHVLQDGVAGYLGGLEMLFFEAACQSDLPPCIGALAEGELHVAGGRLRRLPVPFDLRGAVTAELRFKAGALLSVRALSFSCLGPDPSRFVESFAC